MSDPKLYEKVFSDIIKPTCCSHGDCCKGASPSKPFKALLERAAEGDDFARGFFSLMIPYTSHDEARLVVPGLVERTLQAARKAPDIFPNPEEDVVFYHCRYLQSDNRCGVYEDRPQFCRDYPDTPFVVFAPGCAFEDWGSACREKYQQMKTEIATLKELKEELAQLQALDSMGGGTAYTKIDDNDLSAHNTVSILLSLTPLYVGSPLTSFYH